MNRGPTWDPRTVYAGPTYYSGGTHVGPTRYSGGTHMGPTRYSDGTHVGPTVLLSEHFYLKKIIFLPLFDITKYI